MYVCMCAYTKCCNNTAIRWRRYARSRTRLFIYSPSCVDKWAPLTGTQRRAGTLLIAFVVVLMTDRMAVLFIPIYIHLLLYINLYTYKS